MADTPTRRKPGPPKTKDYTTVSLKIPQALLRRVQRYAKQHQRPVSELFRDGVEWRIGEGDLLSQRYATGISAEQVYSGNTEIPDTEQGETASHGVLQEILTALARQETQLHALAQAFEQRPVESTPHASSAPTTPASTGQQSAQEPTREERVGRAHRTLTKNKSNTVLQHDVPSFDTARYVLGELCTHGHDYHGSGQSLRRRSDHECLACHNARMAAYRQRKRQAQPAERL